jgi:hypothetical protein
MYSFFPSVTLALDGAGGQHHVPAALPPAKETWYPLYRRLDGLQGWFGWVQILLPLGFDP